VVVVQVLRLLPQSRLLLVAPSNLAADLLAQRLLESGRPKSEMMRVRGIVDGTTAPGDKQARGTSVQFEGFRLRLG
jgi:hypothetical protein